MFLITSLLLYIYFDLFTALSLYRNHLLKTRLVTITETVRMGLRRPRPRGKSELGKWGKRGGRPMKQDRNVLVRLERLPTAGESQAKRAGLLGASNGIARGRRPNKVEREAAPSRRDGRGPSL